MGHTKCVQNVILLSQNAQFGSKWGLSIRTIYKYHCDINHASSCYAQIGYAKCIQTHTMRTTVKRVHRSHTLMLNNHVRCGSLSRTANLNIFTNIKSVWILNYPKQTGGHCISGFSKRLTVYHRNIPNW